MNYELVKELKDAGFEEPKVSGGRIIMSDDYCDNCNDHHHAYSPTLEELIAACVGIGRSFGLSYFHNPATWRARSYYEAVILTEHYSTPTEAVARLWISLNKKSE